MEIQGRKLIHNKQKYFAFGLLLFRNKLTARKKNKKVCIFIPAVTADTRCPADCLLMHYNHIHSEEWTAPSLSSVALALTQSRLVS